MATHDDIRNLAVAYSAWNTAVRVDDPRGLVAWGPILRQAQDATGVCLQDDARVARLAKYAADHLAALAAEA